MADGPVGAALAHDSAAKHVAGTARYVDDVELPPTTLHGHVALSPRVHARILRLDLAAVRAAAGVHAVVAAADVPGETDIGPVHPGDPVLADGVVDYAGQALFAVAADTLDQARLAAALAVAEFEDLEPVLSVDEARRRDRLVLPPHTLQRGDAAAAIAAAPRSLRGRLGIGGQEHFYLEGQVSAALPREDGDMLVLSSTQHPSEVQHLVARVLGRPDHDVAVECRRMGGGFGGKETQAAPVACIAALLAAAAGRPVKLRLDRDDDFLMTGKRHDFVTDYRVGFDDEGRILGLEMDLAAACGFSPDLSGSIVDRALFHCDNAYWLPAVRLTGWPCRTSTASNTAFRGFGGPQGMLGIEHVLDEIAREVGRDPLDVRRLNLYGDGGRDVTPYRQRVAGFVVPELLDRIETSADYRRRRREIDAWNAGRRVLRRGLALSPVKFGISFTATHLNQGGALVHVYTDGSVMLNHGGTEMGQGVNIKVAQIVAGAFGIDVGRVKITATSTAKVPNTPPTAASAGSDLNGMAALAAARAIRDRLAGVAAGRLGAAPEDVTFADGRVGAGGGGMSFAELARLAWMQRVQLSAVGYYRTPQVHYDRDAARGQPFYYYACGVACAEAVIDTLTGEYRILRADLLHDVGDSLNPAVDLGQVEGGFVQGLGWLTTEELWRDAQGHLKTHAPSTYKIPTASDLPADFRVELGRIANIAETVHRSKAVGEPPLMLAIAAWLALKDAVAAAADGRVSPRLDAPATPERVLAAVEEARARAAATGAARAAE